MALWYHGLSFLNDKMIAMIPTDTDNLTSNPYANPQTHQFDDVIFDEALIAKYNRQGPRYTSYPTALEFEPIADGAEQAILQQRDSRVGLSLYFHIPFCRHLCYYCACNKIITKKNSDSGDYLDYLFKEIDAKCALLQGELSVEQVHFGGGTPTFLSDDELVQLWQYLNQKFHLKEHGDYSIEIDPRELRPNTLKILRELGFNRLSFGVQDLDETVQIAVNRVQPLALIETVMNDTRKLGFNSINIDLIYGLPKQSIDSLQKTVATIINIAPDRLSVFNYAHLPERFAPQKRISETDLPSSHDKLIMLKNTINQLIGAGYDYIGIDHFARPDDTLAIAKHQGKLHRNFQGYTTHGHLDLLSFGVSSISQIGTHILQNDSELSAYQDKITHHQLPAVRHIQSSLTDELRKFVIMNLLCHDYMDFKDINYRFGIDPMTYFADELKQLNDMAKDKLVEIDAKGVRILPKGRLLGRNVAMVFDEYLGKKHSNRFSKVI